MTVIKNPSMARVVGDLICQKDSYLRSLETKVIACEKVAAPKAVKTKSPSASDGSNGTNDTSGPEDLWEIECEDSVLFPEGGGQPSDHGTLTWPSVDGETTEIPIRHVQRRGLRCMLHSPTPLDPGAAVKQELDFSRRWDHMQQHTGQHLLSAVTDTYENLETLGWGMGSVGGMNYIDVPRKPSAEEIRAVQYRCNELIRQNLPISVEALGDAAGESLPDDYDKANGVIRSIKIGDTAPNTCCGTHLKQTSHISVIILHHMQPIHGKNTRLFFSCGDRAINLSAAAISALGSLGSILSCNGAPDEVVSQATKTSDRNTELKRREKKLLLEIASYEAELAKTSLAGGKHAWVYRPDGGLDFVNGVLAGLKDDPALQTGGGRVAVIASGEEKKPGPLVVFGDKDVVSALAVQIKDAVRDMRGGGKGNKWQGKVPVWHRSDLAAIKALVES